MLTDTALRNLKPKSKIYKVFDRDGMYAAVSPAATMSMAIVAGAAARPSIPRPSHVSSGSALS